MHDPDLKLTSLDLSSSHLPFEFEKYLQVATEAVFTRENAEKNGDDPHYLSRDHAFEVIEAVSFLNQEHGVLLDTLVTINRERIGISDHSQASEKTWSLNNEIGKWRSRVSTGELNAYYILAYENSRDIGFHCHILTALPWSVRRSQLEEYVRSAVPRLAGLKVEETDIDVTRVRRSDEYNQIKVQSRWVKYLLKSLDPYIMEQGPDGRMYPLAALLQLPQLTPRGPILCKSPIGLSRNIAPSARSNAEMYSAIRKRAYQSIWSGWEMREFRERQYQRDRGPAR